METLHGVGRGGGADLVVLLNTCSIISWSRECEGDNNHSAIDRIILHSLLL